MILQEQAIIGERIWKNECNLRVEGLTTWNQGEEFASLGIGHFIWYPKHYRGPFVETFPSLIAFLRSKGVAVPDWIAKECPWDSREAFYADSSKLQQLRHLLQETIALQAEFIIQRFEAAMEKILTDTHLKRQYHRLMKHPKGVFAMVDYLNFKGEGTSLKERYQGVGWGLLQVLAAMKEEKDPVDDFIASAKNVLQERVAHSPPERNEKRWLAGWNNRVDSYGK